MCASSRSNKRQMSGRLPRRLALGLMLGVAAPVPAYELMPDFQIHGFISQGAVHTDHNEIFGTSSTGVELDVREIGVNASWLATPDLRFAGQVLSRHAGEADDGHLRLDYGLLDWTPFSSEQWRAGLRLGRVKMPTGLYNETRDVAHTRPSILLPQSIYTESLRNIMLSADGLTLYGEQRTRHGDFFLDLQGGKLREGDLDDILSGSGAQLSVDKTRTLLGRIGYEKDSGLIRAGLYRLKVDVDMSGDAESLYPGLGAYISEIEASLRTQISGLYVQYNGLHWSLTGEYQRVKSKLCDVTVIPGVGVVVPDQNYPTYSYYLQAGYRFSPHWQMFLRRDHIRNHFDGLALSDGSTQNLYDTDHRRYARDWTLGAGWTPTEQVLLRAEVHHVYGTAWLSQAENPDPDQLQKRWNLFLLEAAYRF